MTINEIITNDDKFLGKGTITVTQMDVQGPSQCAVSDYAMLYLDRRLTWGEDAELAMAQVLNIFQKQLAIKKKISLLKNA